MLLLKRRERSRGREMVKGGRSVATKKNDEE
jgi:hypothetical protein